MGEQGSDFDPRGQAGAAEDLCRHEDTDCAPLDRGEVGCREFGWLGGVCQRLSFASMVGDPAVNQGPGVAASVPEGAAELLSGGAGVDGQAGEFPFEDAVGGASGGHSVAAQQANRIVG